jgi:hypothetical protein
MVVIKYTKVLNDKCSCYFKVHVLGDDRHWKETSDIGELALFVGVSTSLCMPTIGRPQIKAGCIYYTDDKLGPAELLKSTSLSYSMNSRDDRDLRAVAGVYSTLKDGTAKKIDALGAAEQRKQASSSYSDADLRAVGVYCLMDGTVKKIQALGKERRSFYPPPAWITPSIP